MKEILRAALAQDHIINIWKALSILKKMAKPLID